MPELEVQLAGAVSLRRGDRRAGDRVFRGRQLRLVTAVLVLDRQDPVPVDRLASQLWTGSAPQQWRVGLRGVVGRLRRALVDVGMPPDAVRGEPGRYLVDLGEVRVDLEVAATNLATARRLLDEQRHADARDLANDARAVVSRPILPGIDAPWLDALRDRVARQHVDVLTVLGACRGHLGQPAQARSVIAEALDLDPLREDSWRTLMRVEVAAGNVGAALRAYEQCRRRLADDLGVDPSPATRELHADLLRGRGDTAIEVDRPPDPMVDPSPVEIPPRRPPYVGLRAFGHDDADRFFGRDAEVQQLVERLARDRIVVVVGPSGVGKSSLVRAGLLPALTRGAIPDSDTWACVTLAPGAAPLKALATELADLAAAGEAHASAAAAVPANRTDHAPRDGLDVDEVAGMLAQDEHGLHRAAELVLRGRDASTRLMLVVDQLEELFTLGDPEQARRIVPLLATAARRLDGRVVVVATMRADFYDRAAELPALADLLSSSQFVVPPLEGEQVEAAVAGPARAVGARLEDGLLARILTDVAGEPGALPLLQHLLRELWGHRTDMVMTRGVYDDLGGVAGALAQRAESVYGELDADDRLVARRVLLRGVQPGEETGDARRPVFASELVGPGHGHERVERVIARLVDARLLTAGTDGRGSTEGAPARTAGPDPERGDRVFELAHEALIDGWPRLRAWVDDSRGWLLDHRQLTTAARAWVDQGRHDDWLLVGRRLDDAHEVVLADGRGDVDLYLSPAEHELVRASLAAREHDRAQDAARRDRERRLEVRSVRWLRAVVVVVSSVAVVVGVLWVDAVRDGRVAAVRELASAADASLDDDPQRSLQLALAAHERLADDEGDVAETVEAALRAAVDADRLVGLLPDVGRYLATGPAGDVVAVARTDEDAEGWSVDLLDATDGDVRHTLRGHGGDGPVWTAAFSPDGTRLATGTRDGVFWVWDPTSGRRVARLDGPAPLAAVASFNADASLIATAYNEDQWVAQVQVRDPTTGDVVRVLEPVETIRGGPDVPPLAAFFSPDGSRLAILHPSVPDGSQEDYVVRIVDTEDWTEVSRADVDATTARWSPDGDRVAVSRPAEGTVVVDAATGAVVRDLRGPGIEGGTLAWDPDGTRLAVGTDQVRVWTVDEPDAEPLVLTGPHFGQETLDFVARDRLVAGGSTWDVRDGPRGEVATLPADDWQSGLDYSPSGESLAVSSGAGVVTIHDTTSWESVTSFDAHDAGVSGEIEWEGVVDLDWSADGRRLATSGADDLAVWEPRSGDLAFRADTGGGWNYVAITPDGRHVATTSSDPAGLRVLDQSGQAVARAEVAPGVGVSGVQFSPDGRLLASARNSATGAGDSTMEQVVVWDWEADDVVATLDVGASDLDWHPDGDRLVTANNDGSPQVWDVDTWSVLATMDGHDGHVQEATWGPGGDRIATCSGDGTAQVWDAQSGEALQVIADGLSGFCQVRFSPDGRHVAVSDAGPAAVLVQTLDLDELVEIARSRVVSPWTSDECREYLHEDACPA